MASHDNVRDYIYVSGRKVERMRHILQPQRFSRVRKASAQVEHLGFSVELSEPRDEMLSLVPRIESAIDAKAPILYSPIHGWMSGTGFQSTLP